MKWSKTGRQTSAALKKIGPPNKRQRLESSQLDVPLLPSCISPPLFTITSMTRPKHLPQLGSNTLGEFTIMADAKGKATTHLILTLDILEYLGFLINYEKLIIDPT